MRTRTLATFAPISFVEGKFLSEIMQDDLKACRPDDIIYSVLLTCDGQ